jgi:hypothetical protein
VGMRAYLTRSVTSILDDNFYSISILVANDWVRRKNVFTRYQFATHLALDFLEL